MNASVHRVGLTIAALAAVVTIGGFLAVDGYVNAQRPSPPLAVAAAAASADPTADLPPEVVYVRPAPSPQVIHVTETASPAPRKVVHVIVAAPGGETGDGEEGGVDD